MESGQMDQAEAVFSEAVELAQAADEPLLKADASLRLADLRFHQFRISRAEMLDALGTAERVFADHGDMVALARALGLRGRLAFWNGQAEAAAGDLERAARLAREAGDRGQETDNLGYLMTALAHGPTPVDEALRRIDELRNEELAESRLQPGALIVSGWLEGMRGRFEVARNLFAQAQELGESIGMEVVLARFKCRNAGAVEPD